MSLEEGTLKLDWYKCYINFNDRMLVDLIRYSLNVIYFLFLPKVNVKKEE